MEMAEWFKSAPLHGELALSCGSSLLISLENGFFEEGHGFWVPPTKILDSIVFSLQLAGVEEALPRRATSITVKPTWISRSYSFTDVDVEEKVFTPRELRAARWNFSLRSLRPSGAKLKLIVHLKPSLRSDGEGRAVVVFSPSHNAVVFKQLGGPSLGVFGGTIKPTQVEVEGRAVELRSEVVKARVGDEGFKLTYNVDVELQRSLKVDFAVVGGLLQVDEGLQELREALGFQHYDNDKAYGKLLGELLSVHILNSPLEDAFTRSKVALAASSLKSPIGLLPLSSLKALEKTTTVESLLCLEGLCCVGLFDVVKSFLTLLSRGQRDLGLVPKELSLYGGYSPGGVVEQALYISQLSSYYFWSGDPLLMYLLQDSLEKSLEVLVEFLDSSRKLSLAEACVVAHAFNKLDSLVKHLDLELPVKPSDEVLKVRNALSLEEAPPQVDVVSDECVGVLYSKTSMQLDSSNSLVLFKSSMCEEGLRSLEKSAKTIASESPSHPLTPRVNALDASFYVNSLLKGFLGVRVDAPSMRVDVVPYVPEGLATIEISNIPLASAKVSYKLDVRDGEVNIRIGNHGKDVIEGVVGVRLSGMGIQVSKALSDYGDVEVYVKEARGYAEVTVEDRVEGKSTRTFTIKVKR
ncbi:MAG: hypothetical protein DRJ62_01900 [Thermoprotei archaeon]|nr:MAG: hypothetical protein DRJ62_01900 [Thermoprotei archaeon]